jgi:Cu/Ag efflux protein CusF
MMKKTNIVLFACALALASSPSWAWTQKQGSITNIDPKAHQLTLDGTPYTVERKIDLSGLNVGDKVAINAMPRHGEAALVNKVRKIG